MIRGSITFAPFVAFGFSCVSIAGQLYVDMFEVFGWRIVCAGSGWAEHGASDARKRPAIKETRTKGHHRLHLPFFFEGFRSLTL
jgi:hypothetical protein